jgi:hypothetical protein
MGWFSESLLVAQTDAAAAQGWSFSYVKLLVVLAVFAASFGLGSYLSRRWRMPDYFGKFTVILFSFFAGSAVCLNAAYMRYIHVPPVDKIKLGIDLRGGVILVYELAEAGQTTFAPGEETKGRRGAEGKAEVDMDRLVTAIKRRIDPANVKEVTVPWAAARSRSSSRWWRARRWIGSAGCWRRSGRWSSASSPRGWTRTMTTAA